MLWPLKSPNITIIISININSRYPLPQLVLLCPRPENHAHDKFNPQTYNCRFCLYSMSEFKKASKRRNVRKKDQSSSDSNEDNASSSVIRSNKKSKIHNPLKTTSCPVKKPKAVSLCCLLYIYDSVCFS